MKPTLHLLAVATTAALLGACTWGIKLDPAGQRVRTAWSGNVGQCRDLGKVTVSVLSRVGPVDRKDIKVRDELEVMARNEAAKMGADTIRPLGEPSNGEQGWEAYACGAASPQPGSTAPAQTPDATSAGQGVQTFPAKDGGG